MRLDKYLAIAGLGSRKDVKKIIRNGRVVVNDFVQRKDDAHIDPDIDQIFVDELPVSVLLNVYIMLNKPQGVISATEDEESTTVLDLIDIPLPKDVFPVGRLDKDTEGLLLLSNDGPMAHRLLSPKRKVDKVYYVKCKDSLTELMIKQLEQGVDIGDDTLTAPAEVILESESSMFLTITEGRYHQVKRMLHAVDNEVIYLKRLRMGPLVLDESLNPGEWRLCTEDEITVLKDWK